MAAPVDTDALAAAVATLAPTPTHAGLLQAARAATGLDLRLACVDDGWFRMGGVMDARKRRLADDIDEWALAETGGDLGALFDKYGDAGLRFTRHAGRRVYLTAALGPDPLDFLQVEVDKVQEMLCRPLFENGHVPDTLVELESLPPAPDAEPLSAPAYVFRRATHIKDMPELVAGKADPRLKRFVADWSASSAAGSGPFCERWALRIMPYQNADGDHGFEAKPLTALKVEFPDLQDQRAHAVDYRPARSVQAIDAAAGFPMAWYFLQVVKHYAHARCIEDVRADFAKSAPLPERDAAILDRWIADPYTFA